MLPSDPVRLSLQTIMGVVEAVSNHGETSGRVCLVERPGAVMLDRIAQQYACVVTGIGTDQLWAVLWQWVRPR